MTGGGSDGGSERWPDGGPLPELPVRVPDDARDLARDVEALRRERRAQARRARWSRFVVTGRYRRTGLSGALVLGVLLLVAVPATLLSLLTPRLSTQQQAAPLARPTVPPGQVGGLLPEVELSVRTGTLAARRAARPGVLLLVPPGCGCDRLVGEAMAQALEFVRSARVVVDGSQGVGLASREAERLRLGPARGLVSAAVDPAGALARAYDARGLTLLAVAADGVVVDVLRDVRQGDRTESRLSVLQGR